MIIAVPLAMGVAVFTTEMCPKALRGPLSFFVELLAAIPSVIYGLWAIFVLVPLLSAYVQPFLAKTLGWTTLFTGPPYGYWDVGSGNHSGNHDRADHFLDYARGADGGAAASARRRSRSRATRWEMIRVGVLRNARAGIVGGIILGLGRALGETMAVTMVIGNRPRSRNLFSPRVHDG